MAWLTAWRERTAVWGFEAQPSPLDARAPKSARLPGRATHHEGWAHAGEARRERMVMDQIVRRGVRDGRVVAALRKMPRERFVPEESRARAYDDCALGIAGAQTISQPYIVALTLQALGLGGGERVLEVGTGSGYAAALLGCLAGEVFTIERLHVLAEEARERLASLALEPGLSPLARVRVREGDGSLGWPEEAPFDAIAVAAVAPRVPPSLVEQLAPGGRLVMPVRRGTAQFLVRVTRGLGEAPRVETLEEVRFVPLIGAEGEAG